MTSSIATSRAYQKLAVCLIWMISAQATLQSLLFADLELIR